MSKKILFVLSGIFLLLFISNFVYSEEIFNKETYSEDIINERYQEDVFYPPEEFLAKQGFTLESYRQSLIGNAPKNRNSSVNNIWGTTPLSGNIHIPVLLVQFTDNMPTLSSSDINTAFNSPNYLGGAGISVSKYYTKQSYGDLNITFDIYGWQTAPNTYSYYSLNFNRYFEMELAAINMFNSAIDYSQYDSDNDGRIDGFVIIYPDEVSSAPNGIWPHAMIMRNYNSNPVDGKYLGNIAVIPELGYMGNQFEIPISTHEFAHVLGLPDLYNNVPDSGGWDGPIKDFTMMDFEDSPNCLDKPINLDAWSRYFFGWNDPIILTTDSNKEISLRSANDYPDVVILKNSYMTPREFFIIENRYRENVSSNLDRCMFGADTPSWGGFAIYHIDENKIEYDYPNNWVNWDPDDNRWDDTISHPGMFYEQNIVYNYTLPPDSLDFYLNFEYAGCDFRFFDENKRICQVFYAIDDTTTRAYSGVENPFIRFEAISPRNQPIMTAKMLVGEETIIPIATPASGNYTNSISVNLTTPTTGAIIYYTLDGSTPTTSSTVYTTPITISQTTTLKAIAKKTNFYVSEISSNTYTFTESVATPTASLPSGHYAYGTQIELFTTTPNSDIYYTTDGTTPTQSSTLYQSPIIIDHSFALKAIAYKSGYAPSAIATYNYETGTPLQNLVLFFTFQDVDSQTQIDNDSNLITVHVPYHTHFWNLTPIIEIEAGCSISPDSGVSQNFSNPVNYIVSSSTGTRTYTVTVIRNVAVYPPIASVSGGVYSSTQIVELSTATPNAIIRYTLDGTEPNRIKSPYYTGPITISSSATLKAKAYLYVGPDSSDSIGNSKKAGGNIPITVSWYISSTLLEDYIISRNSKQITPIPSPAERQYK